MDQLVAIRSFVEVIDRGGFAAAGRLLGFSGPMVGNHVRFLEAKLGGLLIHRTTRAQRLTELGHAYLARCRHILAELDAAERDAQMLLAEPRGGLRITAPHSIGATLLPPVIDAFLRDHSADRTDLLERVVHEARQRKPADRSAGGPQQIDHVDRGCGIERSGSRSPVRPTPRSVVR